MTRFLALAALVTLTGSPACAANWAVDPAHSTLGFAGTQTGEPFSGTFKSWTARIDYDPAHPEAAHIAVTIDMTSATTGDPQRDEALPGADWFDIATHPQATFEATGFTPHGGDTFETAGTLSIRGISKAVTLPFTLAVQGDTAHVTGKADLVRTSFGVGQGSWASGDYVGLAVGVTIDLSAHRQP